MKLAFCLFKYFPFSGLARDCLRIIRVCQARGHDITVFVSQWDGERPAGLRIVMLREARWMNHSQNRAFYHCFREHLAGEQFDAVIGFNKMPGLDVYYGADYCYIGRAVPRYGPWYRLTPRYHHLHTFERAVFDPAGHTRILSLSKREMEVYQEFYGTPAERFYLLPPTLDSERCLDGRRLEARALMRRQLDLTDADCLLLFVGSGFKIKGLDRTLRALAAVADKNDCCLMVVGQDDIAVYQRLAQRLGVSERVRFLGGRSDIPELLAAGDLLIHPAYSENTGTVLLEAIAAGLPVLTTGVCGYAGHIARADAGIVLQSPFRQDVLNRTLADMLASPRRAEWSANGQRYGNNPTLCTMPECAADVIERWLAQPLPQRVAGAPGERLYLRDDLKAILGGAASFEDIMAIEGEIYREAPGRRTLRFRRAGRSFFLKTHTGVGWKEILKNLLYFRLPVLGATNEWHGIHHLKRLGIDTMTAAGYAESGRNPARRRSFIITEELTGMLSLEDICAGWSATPPRRPDEVRFKRWLIRHLAIIARTMHGSGANHRDFYLVHFLIERYAQRAFATREPGIYLIDLHRMQIRSRTPTRWAVKDISGLYYSSMDVGLTRRDLFRFMCEYREQGLRDIVCHEALFWRRVRHRARRLYASEGRRASARADKAVQPVGTG